MLHEKVGLPAWTTVADVGTECPASSCFTPDDLKAACDTGPSTQDVNILNDALKESGFTPEWKTKVDDKLTSLETNVSSLQKGQSASVSMMAIMLKAQGVPQDTIDEQLRHAGFDPPGEPHHRGDQKDEEKLRNTQTQLHVSDDDDGSDVDLYTDSQKPRCTESTDNAATATIADLREAALMRCSVQNVTSFIIRTRSKFELIVSITWHTRNTWEYTGKKGGFGRKGYVACTGGYECRMHNACIGGLGNTSILPIVMVNVVFETTPFWALGVYGRILKAPIPQYTAVYSGVYGRILGVYGRILGVFVCTMWLFQVEKFHCCAFCAHPVACFAFAQQLHST